MKIGTKITTLIAIALLSQSIYAAAPNGYYTAADNKKGNSLRLALHNIIDNHKVVKYDNLNYLYIASDSRADGTVWDMYSTCTWQHNQKKCGNYKAVCDCYNKEHSVPQSWFSKKSPMVSDAFHVYPTDGKVNGQRSNHPYGECSNGVTLTNKAQGRLGSSTFGGYSGTVFEPIDEYKGDLARTYFYMATRYAGQCESWGHQTFSSSNAGLSDYAVALFLKWHREDPVDEKERVRNDAIYGINNNTNYKQGNRNPFIDYPCLAEYIWGNKQSTNVQFSKLVSSYDAVYENSDKTGCNCTPTTPTITKPDNSVAIEIGASNLNETAKKNITIKGVLLNKTLNLSINGTDAKMFNISTTSITASEALAGELINISYTPTTIGNHTAQLTINSSDLATPHIITITGKCETTLVSPTNNGLTFVCEDVTIPEKEIVTVKATNVNSPITLSLSEENDVYSISTTTITALEAKHGKDITITYQPKTLGKHQTKLIIACSDFPTKNIPLEGACIFNALAATEISSNSFTANWSNAGTIDYTIDVFTMTESEIEAKTLLELSEISKDIVAQNSTILSTSGSCYDENNDKELRLGTSSKNGTLIITGDFSNGGEIYISAKKYHSDKSKLKVIGAGKILGDTLLGSNFAAYKFIVPATTNSKVEILQGNSKERIVISGLKIVIGGETEPTRTSIKSYPRNVGNVTNHVVTNLSNDTYYYYAVTPNSSKESEIVKVYTGIETGNETIYNEEDGILYYSKDGITTLTNLVPQSRLIIYNTLGQLIHTIESTMQTEEIELERGIYIIRNNNSTLKITVQ